MADVNTGGGGGGGKHQKKRAKKLSTRIDMTPMVDLGFLLLTFFMLTTTFSQPKVIELTPPVKSDEKTKVDTTTLTLLLGKSDTVYYYNGLLRANHDSNNIMQTDFSDDGVRKLVLSQNQFVMNSIKDIQAQHNANKMPDSTYSRLLDKAEGNKNARFVIIKTDSTTKYINVVMALDEMNICNIGKYSLIDASEDDIKMIADYKLTHKK
ncbi:MAG TPA: biopolymer transporter ExbD [Bacteroidia bacterium]|jgi:biopolymer transport protein ExbD|nr:biopolymer transporter ExbD [Bacteroidia bacterium]